MSGGAWSNDSTSTLVIPTGATTGARIVLNGVTGQIQVFDSTNALVGQIDSAGIVALGTDGSLVRMYDLAGIARLGLLPGGGNVNEASVIAGVSVGQPQLVIRSPQQTSSSPNNQGLILLTGAVAGLPATIQVTGDSVNLLGNNCFVNVGGIGSGPGQAAITTPNTSIGLDGGGSSIANNIALSAGTLDVIASTVSYNFVAQPMGLCARVDSSANSAAVAAETTVMTLTAPTIKNGRAYEFRIHHTLSATAATVATLRVREVNAVGALISDRFIEVDGNFQSASLEMGLIKNVTGADINSKDAVFTMSSAAGTVQQVSSTTRYRRFELWDIGAASDYPNATPW